MKVPLSWLREYVDIDLPPEELAHRLTMAGTEVGGIEVVGGSWENVFVGYVTSVDPHPNADRLRLATVSLGSEEMTVVCGAPNVAAGQKVPFAKVGARLIDARTGEMETLKAAGYAAWSRRGWSAPSGSLPLATTTTASLCCRTTPPSARRCRTTWVTWSSTWTSRPTGPMPVCAGHCQGGGGPHRRGR